ncbi:DUF3429 domain-containing protein [Brevundimonas sp.]|uniref:DUF3429 domain-containing protein n=1 Tax=Brevundimonas sp. TaxID=1871086 RepID=UPI0035613619
MSNPEDTRAAPTRDQTGLKPLPALAIGLGYAGLLPQLAALGLAVFGGPEWRFTGLSLAFGYAALIYSFLGGVWWGLAAGSPVTAPRWIWIASVLPSLIALGSAWPWAVGGDWPGPSLIVLGIAIACSIVIDAALARAGLTPPRWLALRLPLSLGLGGLTLASGLTTMLTG